MSTDDKNLLAGRYELLEHGGTGGMASVWRARAHGEAGFSRTVAIKRMLPNVAESSEFAAMFVEEGRVVADLLHPNIVQVLDFAKDEHGGHFIVMEWIDGLDLLTWTSAHRAARQRTPWRAVASIGAWALEGLGAAHERRDEEGALTPVLHRDVTPHNILLSNHGQAKVGDWGLARAMDRVTLTMPGVVKGKLAYVAPEMIGGARANAQSDLYSLAIVLWECFAGRRLFEGKNEIELFVKVGQAKIPPLTDHRDDVPPELLEVLERAYKKWPEERWESARAMALALRQVVRQFGGFDAEDLRESVLAAREFLGQDPVRLSQA